MLYANVLKVRGQSCRGAANGSSWTKRQKWLKASRPTWTTGAEFRPKPVSRHANFVEFISHLISFVRKRSLIKAIPVRVLHPSLHTPRRHRWADDVMAGSDWLALPLSLSLRCLDRPSVFLCSCQEVADDVTAQPANSEAGWGEGRGRAVLRRTRGDLVGAVELLRCCRGGRSWSCQMRISPDHGQTPTKEAHQPGPVPTATDSDRLTGRRWGGQQNPPSSPWVDPLWLWD